MLAILNIPAACLLTGQASMFRQAVSCRTQSAAGQHPIFSHVFVGCCRSNVGRRLLERTAAGFYFKLLQI
jgi:hypothetical protein